MNLEKVVFGFFIILAMTLNFGFVIGELDNTDHHHVYELFAVVVVNLLGVICPGSGFPHEHVNRLLSLGPHSTG